MGVVSVAPGLAVGSLLVHYLRSLRFTIREAVVANGYPPFVY